LPLMRTCSKSY